jgi:hypothetical protein
VFLPVGPSATKHGPNNYNKHGQLNSPLCQFRNEQARSRSLTAIRTNLTRKLHSHQYCQHSTCSYQSRPSQPNQINWSSESESWWYRYLNYHGTMGCDVERIVPPYVERHPRHATQLQRPPCRCHREGARGHNHRPTCLRVLVWPRRVMESSRMLAPDWWHGSLKSPPPREIRALLLVVVTIFTTMMRRARG